MKEHPILFSTEMVRAIMDERKTMTRRIVKPQPSVIGNKNGVPTPFKYKHIEVVNEDLCTTRVVSTEENGPYGDGIECPYGKIGHVLWVRETWWGGYLLDENDHLPEDAPLQYWYFADTRDARPCDMSDERCRFLFGNDKKTWPRWKPSIFMPRAACRLFLEITDIRVERLQDISREDIRKEGVTLPISPRFSPDENGLSELHKEWRDLWQSINGEDSWNSNPWVWVISFKRVENPTLTKEILSHEPANHVLRNRQPDQ